MSSILIERLMILPNAYRQGTSHTVSGMMYSLTKAEISLIEFICKSPSHSCGILYDEAAILPHTGVLPAHILRHLLHPDLEEGQVLEKQTATDSANI